MVKGLDEGTEQHILDAAYRVIIQKGKQGARMQEIADEAGVNKALLHYYFRSKDKLYEAVLSNVLGTVLKTVASNIDFSLPFKDLLSSFVRNHIAVIRENGNIVRFFFSEIWTNKEELVPMLRTYLQTADGSLPKLFRARVKKAIKDKEIRKVDPFHLLMNIISLDVFFHIAGPVFFMMMNVPDLIQKKLENDRANQVVEFIWAALEYRGAE